MEISYDSEADAMYIRLADAEFSANETVDERTVLDLDEDGEVMGIELLAVSERFPDTDKTSFRFSQEEEITA